MQKTEQIIAWVAIFYLIYGIIGYGLILINPGEGFRFAMIANLSQRHFEALKSLPSFWGYYLFNFLFFGLMIWKIINVSRKIT